MRSPVLALGSLSLLAVVACSSSPDDMGAGFETGDTGLTGAPDPGPDAGTDTGEDPTGATGADKFDVGDDGMDSAGDDESGCDKVDLLFVIDDSLSMEDEQGSLVASFPGFISAVQDRLPSASAWHLGITTTNLYAHNGPGCLQRGGLVTRTGGMASSNDKCGPFADGYNYMTEADDLAASFMCAAQVGIDGSGDERPVESALEALGPALNQEGRCNEDFSRADALLVLVLITDEEDDHESDLIPGSPGEPEEWFEDLVALRGGIEQNIVVLSLVGPVGTDPAPCPERAGPTAVEGADKAFRLVDLTERFTNGIVGRVCDPSYDDFFNLAIDEVAQACDDFIPPP